MLEGMSVLDIGTVPTIEFWVYGILLLFIGIWGTIMFIQEYYKEFFDYFILGCCIICLAVGGLSCLGGIALHNEPLYTVVLDEDKIDYQEFYDNYAIWEDKGSIYQVYKKGD